MADAWLAAIMAALLVASAANAAPPLPSWSDIRIDSFAPSSDPQACDPPLSFNIHNDGHFDTTPCTLDSTESASGNLTENELASLIVQANLVVENSSGQATRCGPLGGAPPSDVLSLSLATGESLLLFDSSPPGQACYQGGRAAVQTLLATVANLSAKYYPKKPAPAA
jgi:hypothetical protein